MPGYINSTGENDIVDYMRMLERRLARLERGSQGRTGGDDPTVITSLAISGLTLSTQTVIAANDFYQVMMRYSWTAIPDDPSEYNKDALDGYLTSWSLNGVNYTADVFTTDTFIDAGPFTQGLSVTFRVRARTVKGTLGGYTSRTDSTTTDSTAPFQPSTPVVSPYLGQLAIDWNGLDVSAGQPPTDFRFVEVHISTTGSTFTPTVSTLVGTILRGGGTWVATGLTYGTTYYSRLVAVDTVGNRSPASTAGSGVPVQAANGDISSLAVGKLTAGVITAVMTITGRLATALTGARVEMNVNGIQAFNSSGGQTVDIAAATGNATIIGAFKTDFPGSTTPHLEMVNSGDRTTIFFTDNSGSGANFAFMNSPLDGSNVPRIGINSGEFTYLSVANCRSRLFLSTTTGIQLQTITSGSLSHGYGLDMRDSTMNLLRNVSGVSNGFGLSMATNTMSLQRTVSGGLEGAAYTGSDTTFTIRRYGTSAILDGGQIFADTNRLILEAQDVGVVGSQLTLNDSGSISIQGAFIKSNTLSGNSALFTDVWTAVNAAGGATVTYGVTMSTIPVPIYSIESASDQGNDRMPVARSATSFTIQHINSVTVSLHYWAYRIF